MSVVDQLTVAVTGIMLAGTIIFGIRYHLLTDGKWRTTTEAGRFLFSTNLVLGTLAVIVLLTRTSEWWREWAGREWVLFVVYALYAIKPYWSNRLLTRAQRQGEETKS